VTGHSLCALFTSDVTRTEKIGRQTFGFGRPWLNGVVNGVVAFRIRLNVLAFEPQPSAFIPVFVDGQGVTPAIPAMGFAGASTALPEKFTRRGRVADACGELDC